MNTVRVHEVIDGQNAAFNLDDMDQFERYALVTGTRYRSLPPYAHERIEFIDVDDKPVVAHEFRDDEHNSCVSLKGQRVEDHYAECAFCQKYWVS